MRSSELNTGLRAEAESRKETLMQRNLKRHRNLKSTLDMAHPAPVLLTVVPTTGTENEIDNTIAAPGRLSEAVEEFKKERTDTEAGLAQSLSRDLASGPFNVDGAIEKYNAWKAKDDALAAKIKTAEDLRPIIQRRIDELMTTNPEVTKAVLQRKLDQLEKESSAEKDKAALLQKQIDELKALLSELEKSEKKQQAATKKG
jgi:DNA repair exonuclease SbcCD ATPase subunit